ncbi:MDR family MFS transporter [Catenuloplanes japonicus]|uniref:MDR family MFS transporter n=1 Tax=Catenuloplanes japonicus TaxID=33876 RepID=UPI000690184F|nr:MDR family MFS transporter [Catenuloplanes japonicus]
MQPVYRIAFTVMAGGVVVGLDATMTNVALETFLRDLHTTLPTAQWIGTAYLLAMTAAIPATGAVIARFGARRMWLLAVAIFLAGSVLCGLAWSVGGLIAGRVVQGIGGGMILPLSQAIIAQAAGRDRLGRVMAVLGVPAMLGPVLGPVAGGLLLDHAGWRWIFLINIPFCLAALLAAVRFLPQDAPAVPARPASGDAALADATSVTGREPATHEPARPAPGAAAPGAAVPGEAAFAKGREREALAKRRSASATRPDLVGLALLPAGCATLVYGLAEAGRAGDTAQMLIPLLAGVALLAGFVVHAARAHVVPLIDLRLFRHRGFTGPIVVIFLSGVAMFGAIALIPLYFQQVRGATAFEAGLLIAPQGLGLGVALVVAGRLTDRLPPRPIVLTGLTLVALANLFFTRLSPDTGRLPIAAALVVSGLGLGATLVPVMAAPFRVLAPAEIPGASTAIRIFQQLGASFGGALVALLLQSALTGGADRAAAFGLTYRWLTAAALVALAAALLMPATRPSVPAGPR